MFTPPTLRRFPSWTNSFQVGWNHDLSKEYHSLKSSLHHRSPDETCYMYMIYVQTLENLSFHTKPGLHLMRYFSFPQQMRHTPKNALVMLVSWTHSNPAFARSSQGFGFGLIGFKKLHSSVLHILTPSMTIHDPCMVYLPTWGRLILMVNVGKYTYMDGEG